MERIIPWALIGVYIFLLINILTMKDERFQKNDTINNDAYSKIDN